MNAPLVRRRKHAVQSRSAATVTALLDATIQVLAAVGVERATTTRVAERAGASVGTLYQYFPDREALIGAAVERYLLEIEASVAAECARLGDAPLAELASALVDALIEAKWRHVEAARALHGALVDVGRAALVEASARRAAALVARALERCRDARFDDPNAVGLFVAMSNASLLQAAIADPSRAIDRQKLREHMLAATAGYLERMARPA